MRAFSALTVIAMLTTGSSNAQGPAPAAPAAAGPTIGFMHAIHATNNVDRTLAFYTQLFGLTGPVQAFANPGVPLLTNSPGVSLRLTMLRIPGQGLNFELTEFSGTTRTAAQPQIWDPGAPHLKVLVKDMAPVMAGLRTAGAPVITKGGAPVVIQTPTYGAVPSIFVRDPDGFIVQVLQVPAPADAPAGNVLGAIMGETVSDMDKSMAFWRDDMGFVLNGSPAFARDKAFLDLMGLPDGAEYRFMRGVVPGSNARIEFIEIKGAGARTPFDRRVPDPGSSGMAIRVAQIDKLLPRLKERGVRVISRDGALVEWSPTLRNVFVKDPDGLNIELVGEVAASAPAGRE